MSRLPTQGITWWLLFGMNKYTNDKNSDEKVIFEEMCLPYYRASQTL